MKILIADDSEFMRTVLTDLIGKLYPSAEVIPAVDGKEAKELFMEHKPDLVLLDIIMPNMTGIEVLKEIGQEHGKKVVIVSSVGQEETINEAKELGADAYVTKPFDEDNLEKTLKEIIGDAA